MLPLFTQEVGHRLVLVGWSRGAKWCHEILRQLITRNLTMPLRCLLVAPYCAKRFTVRDQCEHAMSIRQSLTTVRSVVTILDTCCKWQRFGDFIKQLGEWQDVSAVFHVNLNLNLPPCRTTRGQGNAVQNGP